MPKEPSFVSPKVIGHTDERALPGGLSNLFSGSRQAQYWQQFTELYTNISREAEEDFQDLFGREFSRAYEEHSARLRRG